MRAGTLSDPRVVALLRKYFVCVEMTELVTRDLIADPEDVALLERYDAEQRRGSALGRAGFHGGEREAFLTPQGELADVFLSLHCGPEGNDGSRGLYAAEARRCPDAAVDRFFAGAARCFERSFGALPRDFEALRLGKAPEVAQAAALVAPADSTPGDGTTLRVWVRADLLMYESLVGRDLVALSPGEARSLLPANLEAGARRTWPLDLFRRLARAAYPRGAGVLVSPADESIAGELVSEVETVSGDLTRGRLRGELSLEPRTDAERGRRDSYRPWRTTRCQLEGDFTWDAAAGRFRSLRLVSRDGASEFDHGRRREHPYRLAVEIVQAAHGGTRP